MSVPLSDTELAEIRERVPSAVCPAAHPSEVDKGHVWVTGSLSGALRCSACHLSQRALDSDEAVLLAEVDRLRAENAGLDDLRLRAFDKNDQLRDELNAAKGQVHAVETVKCWTNEDGRRFVFVDDLAFALGYTPTTPAAEPEPSCGVLNPKVAATCTEPSDHPSPIHRDAFGNTWTRRDGERQLPIPTI